MKKVLNFICCFGLCIMLSSEILHAQNNQPGLEKYILNKIDLLALELQSASHSHLGNRKHYISYISKHPNTILILIAHTRDVNRENMNADVETARKIIKINSEQKGWKWVKIKEQYLKIGY
jgi:hypothetical protein